MDDQDDKKGATEDPQDLKELTRVYSPSEAEVIKSYLESQGIPCIIRGRIVSFIYPFTADGLAETKVLVAGKDLALARELIQAMPPTSEEEQEK